ncbi:MAG: hypothetical protein JXA96_01020 [Sedimentisphaerales bacterium]|nr:hypothetical protein [Sedimentisphaerales bacterium]
MEGKESIEKKSRKGWQGSPRKKTLKRVIQVISGIFLVFLIFIFFIVPAIMSSDKGLQIILSKINSSLTDGKAKISDLSVGWFKGVNIADFSYDDDAGWISVKVKNISTKPNYGSLLTGNFNLGQTQIDTPLVEIDLNKKPVTSASTTSGINETKQPANTQAAAFALTTDFNLKDGNIKLTGADSKIVELAQINTDINIRPPGEQSNFNLGMNVAANDKQSPLEVKGQFKPDKKSGWSMKNADLDIGVNIENLDLESIEPFLEMAGLEIKSKGSITVDIQSKVVDGQLENATGTIKGSQLEIENVQTKETIKTSVFDVDVKLSQKEQMINIEKMNMQTDWAKIQANGAIPTTIKSLDSFLKSDANYDLNGTFDCDVAAIVSQMPITTGLKDNAQITSGNITGEIKTIGSTGKKQIQAQATLANLKGIVDGKQAALSEPILAQAKVSPDKDGVNIDNLNVSSSFVTINANGNLENIKFDGQADLDKLQSELSQFVDIGPYKLTGQFNESGQVSLSEQNVKLSGSSTIKGLNITGPNNVTASIPTGDVTYTLNLDKQKNILNINSLNSDMGFGKFNIKDAIVPLKLDSSETFDVVVNAQQMNLAKLQPFAVLFGGMPETIKLDGIAESLVAISSQKQIFTIKSDSTSLKNLKVSFPDNKPLERSEATAKFDIKLEIGQEQIEVQEVFFRLNSPDLNVSQANINQTQKNGVTKLNGDIELQYDWAALNQIIGPFMPEGLELKGKESNNINFVSEYPTGQNDKLLANMNAKADLGFQQAGYMGLDIGPTNIDIEVTSGVLEIPPFSTTLNEGKLNFGAKADFKKQPTFFIIDQPTQVMENVRINDKTTKTLLKYLNPIFANASNVSGIANLHCDTLSIPLNSESNDDAEIIATVSVTQLRLQASDILSQIINVSGGNITGTTLTIHPTKFILKDGFLRYDNMQIDVGNNPLNFSGVIGLDKSLNMTVTLPYTFEGRTARVGGQDSGRIPLPIKGTVDKPELDTSKLLEEGLKQELPNLLRRGLEELFN